MKITHSGGRHSLFMDNPKQFWIVPTFCLSKYNCNEYPYFEKAVSYGIVFQWGFWAYAFAIKIRM